MSSEIALRGLRQHNLKNVDVRIPHGKVTVVTGLSGSGKSSLAFDTLYAEGQRRYVESLSTYARQFLERMPKPDLDSAENIPPAIAIEQKNPVKTSRSTVGTLTEIYDYLRLLYAKAGRVVCSRCGVEARRDTPQTITDEMLERFEGKKTYILYPPVPQELEDPARLLESCKRRGYLRLWTDGEIREVETLAPQALQTAEEVHVVMDRLVPRPGDRRRLSASVEQAFAEGHGEMLVYAEGDAHLYGYCEDFSCPKCGEIFEEPTPQLFSFNSPLGACSHCRGFGNTLEYDEKLIVPRPELPLSRGAVEPWTKPSLKRYQAKLLQWAKEAGIDTERPWSKLSERDRGRILNGERGFIGVFPFFERTEEKKYKLHVRVFLRRYQNHFPCSKCRGARLRPESLIVKVGGKNIAETCAVAIGELRPFLSKLKLTDAERETSREILRQVEARLSFLEEVGLSYLTLSRLARTLSGGEHQRINLANQLGAALTGTLYVLDEPSIGLHSRDMARLIDIIARIAAAGNTVVVVEHDPAMIRAAEKVVELGPGAGTRGGEVIFEGPVGKLVDEESTPTARYLRGELDFPLSKGRSQGKGWLRLSGARENNLKNVTFKVPLGNLVAVTGVSGSGKSTLVTKTLFPALDRLFGTGTAPIGRFDLIGGFEPLAGVALIDQSPIGRSSRSNPITYMKGWDEIRKFYADLPEARRAGLKPGHFSFNTDGGRCPVCKGEGIQTIEMHFLADVEVTCEACNGKRFKPKVLGVRYRGKTISDVLDMTVSEARVFFPPLKGLKAKLNLLEEVGLGYLGLGQSSTTLSGGEAQRLKIASELARRDGKGLLYILDEPTTGLHGADVAKLLGVLDRLVSRGNTVLVVEHNLDVISRVDWIVDLGPEGGDRGGDIVAEGTPEQLSGAETSHTGRFLRQYFEHAKRAGG